MDKPGSAFQGKAAAPAFRKILSSMMHKLVQKVVESLREPPYHTPGSKTTMRASYEEGDDKITGNLPSVVKKLLRIGDLEVSKDVLKHAEKAVKTYRDNDRQGTSTSTTSKNERAGERAGRTSEQARAGLTVRVTSIRTVIIRKQIDIVSPLALVYLAAVIERLIERICDKAVALLLDANKGNKRKAKRLKPEHLASAVAALDITELFAGTIPRSGVKAPSINSLHGADPAKLV